MTESLSTVKFQVTSEPEDVSNKKNSTGQRKGRMTSLDPDEGKRVEAQPVKCPEGSLTVMGRPEDRACPVYGNTLQKPAKR